MYSHTTLVGRLGGDPEMRYTADGNAVTNVSLAIDQGYKEKRTTIWYRVAFWGKQAEAVNEWCHKGDIIAVNGEIQAPNLWKGKDGTMHCSLELRASGFSFVWSKKKEEGGNGNGHSATQAQPESASHEPVAAAPVAAKAPATVADDLPW